MKLLPVGGMVVMSLCPVVAHVVKYVGSWLSNQHHHLQAASSIPHIGKTADCPKRVTILGASLVKQSVSLQFKFLWESTDLQQYLPVQVQAQVQCSADEGHYKNLQKSQKKKKV